MASSADSADRTGGTAGLRSAAAVILGSRMLMIVAFGVGLLVLGGIILEGTLAGMVGIWGATAVLIGVVGLIADYLIYRR